MITVEDWQRWGALFAIGLAIGLIPCVFLLIGACRDWAAQLIWSFKWEREQKRLGMGRHLSDRKVRRRLKETTLWYTSPEWREKHENPYSRCPRS